MSRLRSTRQEAHLGNKPYRCDPPSYASLGRRTVRKAIIVILIAFAFSILGLSFFLDDLYYRTRPREPHPESGRIYPQWIHNGIRVYLTRTERLPFDYS